jgi:FMN phosphatase YigB (HAD superfamily)
MTLSTLIFDFSRVLIFPKNTAYKGSLSDLYSRVSFDPEFKFHDHFVINMELIDFLNRLPRSYLLALFTASKNLHTDDAVTAIVKPLFSDIYESGEIGYKKSDQLAYTELVNRIGAIPNECLFIDDTIDNVKAALGAGLHASHFHNTVKLIEYLQVELL